MNILLFDLENGSKTLGGRDLIQKKFNFPVLSPASFDEFQNTIVQLYQVKKEEVTVDVGGIKIKENRLTTTTRDDLEIDAVVIDTFSELSKKFQRSLLNKEGVMQLQSWGKLKNKLDGLLEYLVRIPGIVICNCHGKIQTMDNGENKILPYIDGSTKEDISKWFDFVIYTKTVNYPDGTNKYVWQTNHTSTYDHAKDRTQLLDAEIPQDYTTIIKAAKERGFDGAKILVVGSPGTGKTYSLNTLVDKPKEEKKEEKVSKTLNNGVQANGAATINQ
tara:strand:+ start:4095 stop:4919 length:825 start_codon:yes stop_codon:yes gene_type:complete